MDDESAREPNQIEWLSNDPATALDPARIWPSLPDTARHTPSVIATAMIGSGRTVQMPPNVQANSCGAGHRTAQNKLPAALIRSLDGCICAWPHGMENRYGFAASQAVGLPSHQLLRTISCRTIDEINRELLDRQTWSGGFVHHRSDGRPIMTASSWHLHRKFSDETQYVTEVHADIVPSDSVSGTQLADVLAAITHEMSEALTAVRLYSEASRRALRPAWSDRAHVDHGLTRAAEQIARSIDAVGLMRKLGEQLRDSNRRNAIDRELVFR